MPFHMRTILPQLAIRDVKNMTIISYICWMSFLSIELQQFILRKILFVLIKGLSHFLLKPRTDDEGYKCRGNDHYNKKTDLYRKKNSESCVEQSPPGRYPGDGKQCPRQCHNRYANPPDKKFTSRQPSCCVGRLQDEMHIQNGTEPHYGRNHVEIPRDKSYYVLRL